MKNNKTKLYAKALAEVLSKPSYAKASPYAKATEDKSEGQGKVVANFVKLLVKNGQEKKAKEILDLAEDLLLAKQGKRKINFQTARKITAEQKKLLQSVAKDGDKTKETINPELIAGVKIIINNERQFDASMQKKLSRIFAGSR
ncbi:MAG: F0F1 ATP synthase subunit delta [Patescibacteria group bacterium]